MFSDESGFERGTPEIEVERAVAELRFGRPVLLRQGQRELAVMALDCIEPETFSRFAAATEDTHSLFLTEERATRLGVAGRGDIEVPLKGASFDDASRLSYMLGAPKPASFRSADALSSLSAELARTALLLPAMVCAEVTERRQRFSACMTLDASALGGAAAARQRFQQVARTRVPLRDFGDVDFVVFRGGLAQKDQLALVVGKPDLSRTVPIRIHSSCVTGDLCGSLKCDCGDQLRNGLSLLKAAGGGVLLYLDQEGRGTGIGAKMRAYGYQHRGLDTIDADAELGLSPDHRRYEAAVAMLALLGIKRVAVYTNNPTKIEALEKAGLSVETRTPVTGRVTAENEAYLRTKTVRAGHMLDLESLIAAE